MFLVVRVDVLHVVCTIPGFCLLNAIKAYDDVALERRVSRAKRGDIISTDNEVPAMFLDYLRSLVENVCLEGRRVAHVTEGDDGVSAGSLTLRV
jgi:hypothetical protein